MPKIPTGRPDIPYPAKDFEPIMQKITTTADRVEDKLLDIEYPMLIEAAEQSGLAAEYPNDPELLGFYMKKLLVRGWAGTMSATERKYVGLVHKAQGKYEGQRRHAVRMNSGA